MVKLHHIKHWIKDHLLFGELSDEEIITTSVTEAADVHTLIVTCEDESGDKSRFGIHIESLD